MKRLARADFIEMPWRNGGGVTHEIAKSEDDLGLLWRISTARVEVDGPYSRFPGLTRLSAVVEGIGVQLTHEESGQVDTLGPFDIASLSGDALYRGVLIGGGIRHFNLVYDPQRVRAEMRIVSAGWISPQPELIHALYCIEGEITGTGLETAAPGDVMFGDEAGSVVLSPDARVAMVSLGLA